MSERATEPTPFFAPYPDVEPGVIRLLAEGTPVPPTWQEEGTEWCSSVLMSKHIMFQLGWEEAMRLVPPPADSRCCTRGQHLSSEVHVSHASVGPSPGTLAWGGE